MDNNISCSIVLPCYNPPYGWAQIVADNYKAITRNLAAVVEVILVNDGSTTGISDDDITLLRSNIHAFHFVTYPDNKGKGYAVRQGVANAKAKIIIYTDVDFPYTTDSFTKIFFALRDGNDVAIGVKNKSYYSHVPVVRRHISKLLRACTAIFFRVEITDTQCGLKGFTRKAMHEFLATTINRYLFDLEFIRRVSGRYKLKAIEVELGSDIRFSSMNYRILVGEMMNFIKMLVFRK